MKNHITHDQHGGSCAYFTVWNNNAQRATAAQVMRPAFIVAHSPSRIR